MSRSSFSTTARFKSQQVYRTDSMFSITARRLGVFSRARKKAASRMQPYLMDLGHAVGEGPVRQGIQAAWIDDYQAGLPEGSC